MNSNCKTVILITPEWKPQENKNTSGLTVATNNLLYAFSQNDDINKVIICPESENNSTLISKNTTIISFYKLANLSVNQKYFKETAENKKKIGEKIVEHIFSTYTKESTKIVFQDFLFFNIYQRLNAAGYNIATILNYIPSDFIEKTILSGDSIKWNYFPKSIKYQLVAILDKVVNLGNKILPLKKILRSLMTPVSFLPLNYYYIENVVVKYSQNIYCVSTEMVKILQSIYSYKATKIKLLSNIFIPYKQPLVNTSKLSELRKKYYLDNNDFVLLALSRIHPDKGTDLLIEALKKLDQETLPKNLKVFICGELNPEDNPYHQKLLENSRQLKNIAVFFPGFVFGEDKKGYYELSSVFISPSRVEAFGLSILEAMWYKKPIISAINYGSLDILKDSFSLNIDLQKDNVTRLSNAIKESMNWDLEKMGDKSFKNINRFLYENSNYPQFIKDLFTTNS